MIALKLLIRNAFRHKLRTYLTILGITVAILAFGLLRTVVDAWYHGVEASAADRLIARNSISIIFSLPISYKDKIRSVEGVEEVAAGNWFAGIYISEKNFFAKALFKVMEEKGAQIVIGSKHHPSSALKYPAHRRVISRVYATALKLLFKLPVRDTQTGLKIFKTEVLKRIFPRVVCARYAYDLEILANAHRLGYTIAEAPIVLNFQRVAKWGRIRTKDLYRAGMDTLAIFYRMYFTGHYKGI